MSHLPRRAAIDDAAVLHQNDGIETQQ